MKIRNGVFAVALLLGSMPVAIAGLVNTSAPQLAGKVDIIDWSSDTFDFTASEQLVDKGEGTYSYTGGFAGSGWNFDWSLEANADPFIAGNLVFNNATASTQTFNVVLTLPVLQLAGVVNETGELGLSLTDTGGDGSADLFLDQWHGLINPLTPPPDLDMSLLLGSSFNCSGGPGCGTALIPPVTSSQQHSEADHGGAPIDSLGVHLRFDLSAGDTVAFDTRWEVAPVPAPAAVWLFVSGLAGLFGVARVRKPGR